MGLHWIRHCSRDAGFPILFNEGSPFLLHQCVPKKKQGPTCTFYLTTVCLLCACSMRVHRQHIKYGRTSLRHHTYVDLTEKTTTYMCIYVTTYWMFWCELEWPLLWRVHTAVTKKWVLSVTFLLLFIVSSWSVRKVIVTFILSINDMNLTIRP